MFKSKYAQKLPIKNNHRECSIYTQKENKKIAVEVDFFQTKVGFSLVAA